MMQLTAAMVGMLGGPALQVLVVLMIEREWRSLSYLVDMTNQSEKTVHQAVRKLRTLGMIGEQTREREKCYLVGDMTQLPLMAPELAEESYPQPVDNFAEPVDKTMDNSVSQAKNGASSVNFTEDVLNESMNESLINLDNDSFIDSCDISGNSGPVTKEKLAALGFYGRGLADMLKLPGLTLPEVEYHVKTAPSLGAALARIKKRQPIPTRRDRDGPAEPDRERSKYVCGEYAEFINH